MSWFTSSPARRNAADNTASATASRWRICRMRHHERGFAFAIDESDAPTDTYGLLLRYRARGRPRQFLSSAVPFENGQDVLRRVRSRRADVSGPLRPRLPKETSRRGTTGGPRHRTMHVLRLLPPEVGLVQGRPRARPHGTPSRDDPEAGPMGTRHVHARRPRGGREQPLADGEGARAVRGPAVRPRLPSPRADQALSLRLGPEGGPRSVPCDVPRPPRPVPHRRRGAIQGIPRGGDVGPAVRHPEGPGERRVAALQAERRPEREARRRGAVRGKDRTPGVRPDGRGPSGVRGGAARPPSAESTDRARGRRVDPGRGVLVAPPAGEFEALKGAATLSTQ